MFQVHLNNIRIRLNTCEDGAVTAEAVSCEQEK